MDFVRRYAEKPSRHVIGLMSGTSADGIDAALARISGSGAQTETSLLRYRKAPFARDVRERIFRLFQPDCPVPEVCRMNFAIGELFAQAARDLMAECRLAPGDVDLIASHGQTICHLPEAGADGAATASTLQIGEPAVIAERAGVTTVANFRARDVAAGGQGAPLVPFADFVLFHHPTTTRAIQNIGGIANVTLLPAGCSLEEVIAFDTGPGNMLIDGVVFHISDGDLTFDVDGRLAAQGTVRDDLLDWLMAHAFIGRTPPKSTGREEFGAAFLAQVLEKAGQWGVTARDLVATVTAFTAQSIAANYREFLSPRGPIDEIVLGGGGSYNPALRRMLQQALSGPAIYLHEDLGIPGAAKEALAFAILGNETMLGGASSLPGATGARGPRILGQIVPASGG